MLRLTQQLETEFDYNGHLLHLNLAFDNILRLFDLFADKTVRDDWKVDIACEMLIKEYEIVQEADIYEKNELLLFILSEFLHLDLSEEKSSGGEGTNSRSFDFEKDAGMIYASFMSVYNMDLFEQQGKLHFLKFMQLLEHIDDNSKIKEVIRIRTEPLPAPDKHNKAERERLQKLKSLYSLEKDMTEEEQQEKLSQQFNQLGSFFGK